VRGRDPYSPFRLARSAPLIAVRSGAVGVKSRAAIATAALSLTVAVSSAPGAGAPPPLLPDLVVLPVQRDDLLAERYGDRILLRFSTEIANRGDGPLEVFPSPASNDCDGDGDPGDDRDTFQRVFADSNGNGLLDRGLDAVYSERRFGCMHFHAAHGHWHVLDIAAYELRREPQGKTVAGTRKVGFCLSDNRLAIPGERTPPAAVYPIRPVGSEGCDATATEGLSVGWADLYALGLPGQDLEISGLPRGRYCLILRADPRALLEESDELNDVRRVRLRLRPDVPDVRKLDGPCRA
jgi:Lysyl oxidase